MSTPDYCDERDGLSREDLRRWADEFDALIRARLPRGRIVVMSIPHVPADWFRPTTAAQEQKP